MCWLLRELDSGPVRVAAGSRVTLLNIHSKDVIMEQARCDAELHPRHDSQSCQPQQTQLHLWSASVVRSQLQGSYLMHDVQLGDACSHQWHVLPTDIITDDARTLLCTHGSCHAS